MLNRIHPNIVFSYITLSLFGLCDNLRGPLFPEILQATGVSSSLGAWFFATGSLVSFFGAASVSKLVHRFGYKHTLSMGVLFLILSQLTMFLAGPFWQFICGAVLFGVAVGILGVVQNVLVVAVSGEHNRNKLTSGLHANYAGASLLAPLFVALVAKWTSFYQFNFLVTAVLGLIVLVKLQKSKPLQGPISAVDKFALDADTKISGFKSQRSAIIFLATWAAIYVASEIIISSRLSQFARESLNWDQVSASNLTLQFFIGMFLGRILTSFVQIPISTYKQLLVSMSLSLVFALIGIYWWPSAFFLLGIVMGPSYPLAIAYLSESFHGQVSQATQWTIQLTGVSVVSMHVVTGLMTDKIGIQTALLIGPLCSLVCLLMLFLFPFIFSNFIKAPALKRQQGI